MKQNCSFRAAVVCCGLQLALLFVAVAMAAEPAKEAATTGGAVQASLPWQYTEGEDNQTLLSALPKELRDPQVLPREMARNLIDGLMEVEPIQPNAMPQVAPLKKTRGKELTFVYRKAAPAVVFIINRGGSGSGFLISKDGWIITNHHVVKDALLNDDLSLEVTVNFGALDENGSMKTIPQRYTAKVYKWDKVVDLALLKLNGSPFKSGNVPPVLKLANAGPPPGDDVVAIGNAGITLLWSLKPGVVQAVGNIGVDTPDVLRRWEERTKTSAVNALGNAYEQVMREVTSELKARSNLLYIQATCPILPGDSGGPLLNMKGEVVGVTDLYRSDIKGGRAQYFIHAKKVKEFLKEIPDHPLTKLPDFWEAEPDEVKIQDLDSDGKPETIACFKTVSTSTGTNRLFIACGWDLNQQSDLKKYTEKVQRESISQEQVRYDVDTIFKTKAMQVQVFALGVGGTRLYAYDLNSDGYFELVRLSRKGNGKCDAELYSQGPGSPYRPRHFEQGERVLLSSDRVPALWRERYQKAVIELLSPRQKPPTENKP